MEGGLDEKGISGSGVGDTGAVGETGLGCRKSWALGCNAEKDGDPSTERRREGLGCARCLWGMTGVKDGLGILTGYHGIVQEEK